MCVWGGGEVGVGGAGNECDTAPHTLSPHTPHISRPTFPTPSYPHMPAGKIATDNKERVQLTGCKASVLSLQFDYQVSDTRAYIQTHAKTHNTHIHPYVSFIAITTGETGSSCLQRRHSPHLVFGGWHREGTVAILTSTQLHTTT